jgi:heme exporter protein A
VNLARLYLVPAKLWILDEPFTAIDKTGVVAIESLISTQVANGGAVIVTTHQSLQNVSNVRGIELG